MPEQEMSEAEVASAGPQWGRWVAKLAVLLVMMASLGSVIMLEEAQVPGPAVSELGRP